MRIRKKEPSVGILGKIVNSFTNSKNDTYSADYLNKKIDGKVIFEQNLQKTDAQEIDIDATGYNYYSVQSISPDYVIYETGKIPIGEACALERIATDSTGWYLGRRIIKVTTSKLQINDCAYGLVTDNTIGVNNKNCVPLHITLYK